MPPGFGITVTSNIAIFPGTEALSAHTRLSNLDLHRWIRANALIETDSSLTQLGSRSELDEFR